MIRNDTLPTPKHRRSSIGIKKGLVDVRDYPDNVCPGRRCAGRRSVHVHQSGMIPIHTLTPDQIGAVSR